LATVAGGVAESLSDRFGGVTRLAGAALKN